MTRISMPSPEDILAMAQRFSATLAVRLSLHSLSSPLSAMARAFVEGWRVWRSVSSAKSESRLLLARPVVSASDETAS